MLIDLGRVTRETKLCEETSNLFDTGGQFRFVRKAVGGVNYLCDSVQAGYTPTSLCIGDANTVLDCTK